MDEKDFRELSAYKQGLDDNGNQRPVSFYEKYIKKQKAENGGKKEPKSVIWWMIMIFCLVYGFEILYKAMLTGPVAP